MTQEPIARVTGLLESNGYAPVNQPLEIGGLNFWFSSILLGGTGRPELIVVVDALAPDAFQLTASKIEALARALDVVGSRRSLTIVLVGTAPDDASCDKLRRFGRVLHADHGVDAMADDLAVLLPLSLPDVAGVPDHSARLRERLMNVPPYIELLLDSSRGRACDVTEALLAALAEPFERGSAK
jgi:hypothetical protein